MMFYIFLFLALLGTGVGLFPIPEDIIVLSAGVGVEEGVGNIAVVFVIIFLGILISDSIIFLAGKKIGIRIFDFKFFSFLLPKEKVEKVNGFFDGHSKKLVFLGRFTSGFRPIVFFVAGMSKFRFISFLFTDILASFIYIPLMLFLGFRFSYDISKLVTDMRQIYHLIEILLIIFIVSWLIFRVSKKIFGNGNNNKNV
ncbi:DedA family protein [Patescibacteria group bacterium]|nr:DedA family protein [Patescibacteria group bacterium]MBU2263383.1 DedA family protein [Patescibacteria group bacterium]